MQIKVFDLINKCLIRIEIKEISYGNFDMFLLSEILCDMYNKIYLIIDVFNIFISYHIMECLNLNKRQHMSKNTVPVFVLINHCCYY